MIKKILVVDDNESVRYSFQRLLHEPSYKVSTAKSGSDGLEKVTSTEFDLIILDVRLPDMSGLDVLRKIKQVDPKAVVLIMTAFGTTDTAIEATKLGAYDYILKPFDIPSMKKLIDDALHSSRLMHTNVFLATEVVEKKPSDLLIGHSRVMQEVYKMIGRVAPSDINVLIRGESGTGKELVARAIYQHSTRSQRPFLAVNCAAIPESLLESELFGHEKGAFTGANRRRTGKFEQTNGGTIFLDEIGDMSLTTQAKILRVIQEGCFERLGGEQTVQVDTRIIAATNKNLERAIEEQKFREDLYYRIKVVSITLPPLRLRQSDIPDLIDYFLDKHCSILNKERLTLTEDAHDLLLKYHWPGNVRELENLICRAIVLCKGQVITSQLFKEELKVSPSTPTPIPHLFDDQLSLEEMQRSAGHLYSKVMERVEKALLESVLTKTGGNQVQAAKILGISRVMLRDRIVKYHIKDGRTID